MSQSSQEIEILSEERLHDGFMKLDRYQLKHTLYQGGWSQTIKRERLKRRDAVAVIPYDPARDEIILIEQFRVGAIMDEGSAWLTEIIAGEIEEGEQAEAVARRETEEESGVEIEKLHHCFDFYLSPGGSSEKISLFCGLVDTSIADGIHGLASEGEDIKVTVVKLSEALEQVNQGLIRSAIPIVGVQWLVMNKDRVRNDWGFEPLG